jgi:prophage antirepressor-like protein
MNDLARLVRFSFGLTQDYHIVDRAGNPWFVLKDFCKILGIKNPSDTIKDFPEDWKSIIVLIYSGENGKKIPHKILLINEAGLYRLITRSDKPVARELQAIIFEEILPTYRKHGINWAAMPKIWNYRGQMLNYPEWRAKKEEAYFKRFPDKDYADFLRSLPACPPLPQKQAPGGTTRPLEAEKRGKSG